MYTVKEIFYTLQGEGANAGTPAVFCRFTGCNLWSGREEDRAQAICKFCDTDFVGTDGTHGGKFENAGLLADKIAGVWEGDASNKNAHRFVVCTGGEPLLQMDDALVEALHARGFRIAIETNGTQPALENIDWICVSPKAGVTLALTRGDELKLIYPQAGAEPAFYEALAFDHFFLQPMDDLEKAKNTALAAEYCLAHPQWRLSIQTHKLIGIR